MSINAARGLRGPQAPQEGDLEPLNALFSYAFTDRYRRDGLNGVRVPKLNPQIWKYAIQDAGGGAMLWFDERDELAAFNIAHHSGAEGWMGPLAVRPDRQFGGVGKLIVGAALDWLRSEGVSTIGLETMPRTVENIGFYSKLGFIPQHLTITMSSDTERKEVPGDSVCLGDQSEVDRIVLMDRCRERLNASVAGYDFTREFTLTHELEIGDTVVLERDGGVRGFALWHSAPLTGDGPSEELRMLKVFADSGETFEQLVRICEQCAVDLAIPRLAIRCQTAYADAFRALTRLGYSVRWTDLRMTFNGYAEAQMPPGEILFSNWEI
jgi:GNAT superfamily N-acetyltransferase